MAAIARRPRLPLFAMLAVSVILAACSLLKPEQTAEDKQEHAQALVQTGKHAEAAQAYAELATLEPAAHDNYQLLSTEQWLAAGNIGAAKQAFATVSARQTVKVAWQSCLKTVETPEYFLIYASKRNVAVVPKRAFPPEDLVALSEFLRDAIPAAKPSMIA